MSLNIYEAGKRTKQKRDLILIALLYGMIFFMVTTSYFALQVYVLSGHQCTAERNPSND